MNNVSTHIYVYTILCVNACELNFKRRFKMPREGGGGATLSILNTELSMPKLQDFCNTLCKLTSVTLNNDPVEKQFPGSFFNEFLINFQR